MIQRAAINAKTTIWRNTPAGLTLIQTLPGLPFGTATEISVAGLGEARRSGMQTSGSGSNEAITEVRYTLK